MERWISRIAVGTFVYYLATFAFETGFFWHVGLEYMSAFGLSEHTLHAASYIVGVAGAFAFLWAASMLPAFLMEPHARATGQDTPQPSTVPVTPARRRIGIIMQLPALVLFGYMIVAFGVHAARAGPSPVTIFPVLVAVTFLAAMLERVGRAERHLWLAPAALTVVLAPFALGQSVFEWQVRAAGTRLMRIGDQRIVGRPLLVGTERLLVRVGDHLYVLDRNREFVVRVGPVRPSG